MKGERSAELHFHDSATPVSVQVGCGAVRCGRCGPRKLRSAPSAPEPLARRLGGPADQIPDGIALRACYPVGSAAQVYHVTHQPEAKQNVGEVHWSAPLVSLTSYTPKRPRAFGQSSGELQTGLQIEPELFPDEIP